MSMSPTAAAPPIEGQAARAKAGFTALILFSLGHFFIDLYSSALGAFQPFLAQKLNLTLTQAGILASTLVFSSSLMQPAYGYISDRFHTRLLSALSPAVAGIFIASLGSATGFGWLVALVFLGGVGVAAFHPQATARATAAIETNKGRWMAVFISSGTLGFALGPTFFTGVITQFGLDLSYTAALPGIAITVLLLWMLPEAPRTTHTRTRFDWEPLRAVARPLTILFLLVFIRSILQITFAQFLPLYLSKERGFGIPQANFALSLYLAAGALGGFVGGHASDRFGGRRVIQFSMLACIPLLAVFFLGPDWAAIPGLMLGGAALLFTIPVNVVMGQDLVPSQAGTVSSLMMGFAWGTAGILFLPLVAWVADQTSLHTALASLLVFPLAGWLLTLWLPDIRHGG
ncbi:MAG: MFS transporter [Acidobacteria bacterium]|nr:MFS transporter [Acidobacteriota bacterium]